MIKRIAKSPVGVGTRLGTELKITTFKVTHDYLQIEKTEINN